MYYATMKTFEWLFYSVPQMGWQISTNVHYFRLNRCNKKNILVTQH